MATAEKKAAADAVFQRPTEFLRWLKSRGVTLSKKNLYERYFGSRASHPVKTSPDGRRIHAEQALELIKLVQAGDVAGEDDSARIIRERQQAEALYKSAKGQDALIELETKRGERLRKSDVSKVWASALESFKNALRSMEHNISPKLVGKSEVEIRTMLADSHHEAMRLLAADFTNNANGIPTTGSKHV